MYIATYTNDTNKTFHVGDKIKNEEDEICRLFDVKWIQADGHELEAIRDMFSYAHGHTIPMPHGQVGRWYGDIARTIHLNLISYKGFAV